MVKRRFHSFLLTDIHLCDLCVLCGKKYRGGEVSTEEYRVKATEEFRTSACGAKKRRMTTWATGGGIRPIAPVMFELGTQNRIPTLQPPKRTWLIGWIYIQIEF